MKRPKREMQPRIGLAPSCAARHDPLRHVALGHAHVQRALVVALPRHAVGAAVRGLLGYLATRAVRHSPLGVRGCGRELFAGQRER